MSVDVLHGDRVGVVASELRQQVRQHELPVQHLSPRCLVAARDDRRVNRRSRECTFRAWSTTRACSPISPPRKPTSTRVVAGLDDVGWATADAGRGLGRARLDRAPRGERGAGRDRARPTPTSFDRAARGHARRPRGHRGRDAARRAAPAPGPRCSRGGAPSAAASSTALRARDPADRIPWITGPMSAVSFATARLMETWAHGQDVVDALGVARAPTARLRHVADLGVRTRPFSYAVNGRALPDDGRARRARRAPTVTTWTWGESTTDVVRGDALDFCLVVTRRRRPGRHRARGDGAARARVDRDRAGVRRPAGDVVKIEIRGHHLPGRTWQSEGRGAGQTSTSRCRSARTRSVSSPATCWSAKWDVDVQVVTGDDGALDFKGPAVHGKRGERFLYLTWGDVGPDESFAMFRRAKLMLNHVDADLVSRAERLGRAVVANDRSHGRRGRAAVRTGRSTASTGPRAAVRTPVGAGRATAAPLRPARRPGGASPRPPGGRRAAPRRADRPRRPRAAATPPAARWCSRAR